MIKNVVLVSFFLLTVHAMAVNYYLSDKGNDANSGKKPQQAWQSIRKLNAVVIKSGDSVLFERGGTYRGELAIRYSGTAQKNIVYGAFGKGKKPILCGAEILTVDRTDKIASYFKTPKTVYHFYVDDSLQTLARYPNSSYLTIRNGHEKSGFKTDKSLPDSSYLGATIRMRTIDWVYENRVIQRVKNGILEFNYPSIYTITDGYGYYLENRPEFLDQKGEWVQQRPNELAYIPRYNLRKSTVEATIYKNGITVFPSVKNVKIQNIQLEKYAKNGIHLMNQTSDVDITENTIRQIEEIAVFIDTLSSNISVSKNLIEDVRGRGVFGIRVTHCKILHNQVNRIGLIPGLGMSGVNGMISIAIQNDEQKTQASISRNNYIGYNKIDSNGYAGIRMDGAYSVCEYNIVKNNSLMLNDAGGIYCFGKVKNKTFNNIIRNNLVIGVYGNIDATPDNPFAAYGIYLDNRSTGVEVYQNTVMNVVNTGIVVNDDAPKNRIHHNTIYNASSGIAFSEWANRDSLYGCNTTNNTIVCTSKEQKPLALLTFMSGEINPGHFDYNTYVNGHDGFVVERRTDPEKGLRRMDMMRLDIWKKLSNQDMNSKSIVTKPTELIYNDSFSTKEITLPDGAYEDIYGKKLGRKINLEPCASFIICKIE